jgi:hypothetical protein
VRGGDLNRLLELARLRADLSAQKAARASARVAALAAQADALRVPVSAADDLQTARAQDRHALWRGTQLRTINLQLARASAEAEPLRHAHARDRARVMVLEKLRDGGPRRR